MVSLRRIWSKNSVRENASMSYVILTPSCYITYSSCLSSSVTTGYAASKFIGRDALPELQSRVCILQANN